jgi:hypothetical protein
VSRRFGKGTPATLLLSLCAFAATSQNVVANPIGLGPDFSNSSDALIWLFFSNFPMDLFWFTVVLYFVFRGLGLKAGRPSRSLAVFAASVLVAALSIAGAGAFIDFYAFYDGSNHEGYTFWADRGAQFFGSPEFFIALIGIFVSIYLVSLLIVRMDWKPSIIPAAVMTALNPLAWVLLLDTGNLSVGVLLLSTVILAAISFFILLVWHMRSIEGRMNANEPLENTGKQGVV